jgi:hypothetical protein
MDYRPKSSSGAYSIINVDRDSSIEQNKEIYQNFHTEMTNIQHIVDALNIDYFNKLS